MLDMCFALTQVKSLARDLYENHFKVAESHPRDVVAKLNSIVQQLESACDLYNDPIKVRIILGWEMYVYL